MGAARRRIAALVTRCQATTSFGTATLNISQLERDPNPRPVITNDVYCMRRSPWDALPHFELRRSCIETIDALYLP